MSKPIKVKVKLQAPAGKANPAPPIGPALGQHGVNIMEFCNQFNEQTKNLGEVIIPVKMTIYEDRSFDFILKSPPAAELLKKAAKIEKGSSNALKEKVGKVSRAQIREIAELKKNDLNAHDIKSAQKIIEGTAKSMGLEVENE